MSMPGAPEPSPDLRVSDHDREQTVELLRAHTAEGRLDLDEFSERVASAYSARTMAELQSVTRDLPVPAPRLPLEERPRGRTTHVIACLGGNRRTGRWRPGRRVHATAIMGGAHLDLRDADFESDVVSVLAISVMGGVHIIVPEGMRVEFSGLPILGGTRCKAPDPAGTAVGPVLRVRAVAVMGGVHVVARPPKGSGRRSSRAVGPAGDVPGLPGGAEPPGGPGGHDRHGRHGRREQRAERRGGRYAGGWDQPGSPNGDSAGPGPVTGAGTVTVLFTDVVGFTELTQRVGDDRAQELLRHHSEVVRAEVAAHGGREVKATGDGFLVVFTSARQAVRCAAAIQQRLRRVDGALPVRIGLNSGDALHDGGDVLGFTVNVAARIADAAGPGEILVAAVTRELAGAVTDVHFGDERSLVLQGVSGPCHVHAVDWVDVQA